MQPNIGRRARPRKRFGAPGDRSAAAPFDFARARLHPAWRAPMRERGRGYDDAMFLREPQGIEQAGAGAGRALVMQPYVRSAPDRWRAIDWTPDLGTGIGGRAWWRGLASCAGLCGLAWLLAPGLRPLAGMVSAPLAGETWEEARAQGLAPLGLGADTGRRMAATDLVRPLSQAPERPRVELSATLGEGDRLSDVLARAGLGRADVEAASRLVARAVPLDELRPGTHIALTLGRRADRRVARPLEALAMRARFDLDVSVSRAGGSLAMIERPIAIDHTPLRLQGLVGSGLYRSVRAAGVPADAAADYMKAVAGRLSIGRDIAAADRFDVVLEQDRAATGEVRLGRLLLAAVDRQAGRTQLVRWPREGGNGSHEDWFDARGQGTRHEGVGMPVEGHVTSRFGLRFHPILGFTRMHKGLDIGAPIGTPVTAAADGMVLSASWSGGYGRFIRLRHAGTLATGYGHLSRFAVHAGETVRAGQVIGFVGSTGMSTGPHLHWEVWRGGVAVNPERLSFASVTRLSGAALGRFQAAVAGLAAVRPGVR